MSTSSINRFFAVVAVTLGLICSVWSASIDVLFVYDQSAQGCLTAAGHTPNEFSTITVGKMNEVLDNSGLSAVGRFNAVDTMLVGANGNGNIEEMLYDVVCTPTGEAKSYNGYNWSAVHDRRESVKADVVCVMVKRTSGSHGISYQLNSQFTQNATYLKQFSDLAYSVVNVESAMSDYVAAHEVFHLLGAGHADDVRANNGESLPFSGGAAWYFSTESGNYATLLGYSSRPGMSGVWNVIPYLSSPSISYQGVATGDSTHNNAKVVRDNFAAVSAFRVDSSGSGSSGTGSSGTDSTSTNSTDTDSQSPSSESVEKTTAYTKTAVGSGALTKDGAVAGVVQLKFSKYNARKNFVKVSGSVLLLNGKKVTSKAISVTPQGNKLIGKLVFKEPVGELAFTVDYDSNNGTYVLGGDEDSVTGYGVEPGSIGGIADGEALFSTALVDCLDCTYSSSVDCLSELMPWETMFTVVNGKWKLPSAGKVKYAKNRETKQFELQYDADASNNAGLKLSYTAKTGAFKGSFTAYDLKEVNGKTKLVKYKFAVTGVVVGGEGTGIAVCKKPMMTLPVWIWQY